MDAAAPEGRRRSRSPASPRPSGRLAAAQRRAAGAQLREADHQEQQLGHDLRVAGPYSYCRRCAAFARLDGPDRAKGLKEACRGPLSSVAASTAGQKKKRQYLAKLERGLDPISGKSLG